MNDEVTQPLRIERSGVLEHAGGGLQPLPEVSTQPMCESANEDQNDSPRTGSYRHPAASGEVFADLPAFARELLWALHRRGPSNGVTLKIEIEAYYGDSQNPGRVYSNLNRLVEKGLVEKAARDKRTNEYALTSHGKTTLKARRAWINGDEANQRKQK
jgi:hypothetical protein